MIKVLFVCHGNICRSPMAEFVLRNMIEKTGRAGDFYVESCAVSTEEIGNDIHKGTRSVLSEHKIPYKKRSARQITKSDFEKFDYIIAMDEYNIRSLKRLFGAEFNDKIFKLLEFAGSSNDVADPWYTGDFNKTYEDIVAGCTAFLTKI